MIMLPFCINLCVPVHIADTTYRGIQAFMYGYSVHVQAVMYALMHGAIHKHTVTHSPQIEPHVFFFFHLSHIRGLPVTDVICCD